MKPFELWDPVGCDRYQVVRDTKWWDMARLQTFRFVPTTSAQSHRVYMELCHTLKTPKETKMLFAARLPTQIETATLSYQS